MSKQTINFDLEDGLPAVAVTVDKKDLARFTVFLDNCTRALPLLEELRDYAESATLEGDPTPQCVLDADSLLDALK